MKQAGMPVMKAIKQTIINAKILEMDTQIFRTGYLEILLQQMKTTEDINTVTNVVFVMKEGVVYKQ
jgi:hypothetical protein